MFRRNEYRNLCVNIFVFASLSSNLVNGQTTKLTPPFPLQTQLITPSACPHTVLSPAPNKVTAPPTNDFDAIWSALGLPSPQAGGSTFPNAQIPPVYFGSSEVTSPNPDVSLSLTSTFGVPSAPTKVTVGGTIEGYGGSLPSFSPTSTPWGSVSSKMGLQPDCGQATPSPASGGSAASNGSSNPALLATAIASGLGAYNASANPEPEVSQGNSQAMIPTTPWTTPGVSQAMPAAPSISLNEIVNAYRPEAHHRAKEVAQKAPEAISQSESLAPPPIGAPSASATQPPLTEDFQGELEALKEQISSDQCTVQADQQELGDLNNSLANPSPYDQDPADTAAKLKAMIACTQQSLSATQQQIAGLNSQVTAVEQRMKSAATSGQ